MILSRFQVPRKISHFLPVAGCLDRLRGPDLSGHPFLVWELLGQYTTNLNHLPKPTFDWCYGSKKKIYNQPQPPIHHWLTVAKPDKKTQPQRRPDFLEVLVSMPSSCGFHRDKNLTDKKKSSRNTSCFYTINHYVYACMEIYRYH